MHAANDNSAPGWLPKLTESLACGCGLAHILPCLSSWGLWCWAWPI